MESTGLPGHVQVTERVHDRVGDRFRFEERGWIDVKGKGEMKTYLLLGKSAPPSRAGRTLPRPREP
jgi:adenylate cyclase